MQPHLPPLKVENLLKEQPFFKLPQSSLNLKVNGTVRAEVVDVLPSGSVVVRMNGQELELRTEIPLQKDTTLLLKVLEMPGSDKAIKLQLLDIENPKEKRLQEKIAAINLDEEFNIALKFAQGSSEPQKVLQQLVQKGLIERFHLLSKEVQQLLMPDTIASLKQNKVLQQIHTLLSKQNQNIDALKQQLLSLGLSKNIQQSIASANTIQELQKAILDILKSLTAAKEPSVLQNYLQNAKTPQEFFARLDQLSSIFFQNIEDPKQLQRAIADSGVLLETKLSTFSKQFMLLQSAQESLDSTQTKDIVSYLLSSKELDSDIKQLFAHVSDKDGLQQVLHHSKTVLHKKLQETLDHDLKAIVSKMISEDPHSEKLQLLHQNIQNYQLLSTLTGLLHTYLPLFWEDLKEGAIKIGRKKSYFLCDVDLEFEDIGRVYTKILQMQNSLKIDFFIEDKDFEDLLRVSEGELLDELQDFDEVIVTFVPESEEKSRYTFKNGIEIHV